MRRLFILAAMFGLVIFSAATSAFSCTCISNGPPCQAYGNTAVVFIGTPIDLKQTTAKLILDDKYEYPQRLFTFRVEEQFRGINAAQVEIRTGMGGGDCGYNFKLGERYLVYGSFNPANGLYATSICTRTRLVSEATEDLDYIRGLSTREAGATISGVILRHRSNLETGETQQLGPLANIRISVEGEGKSFTTQTDEQGRYQLTKLAPGKYKIKPALPSEWASYDSEQTTTIKDRGCSVVSFYVTDTGRITGRVIDADGEPVPHMMVDLIPATQAGSDRPRSLFVSADAEGRFELKFVPPGNYLLGSRLSGLNGPDEVTTAYPRSYYPGVAKASDGSIISIGEGTSLKDINLRLLPRMIKRVISGRVIFPDGGPVTKASVARYERTDGGVGLGYGISVDDQGNFSFDGYEGISYYVKAVVNGVNGGQRHSEPVEVAARGPVNNLVLTITEPNGNCARCLSILVGKGRPGRP